MSDLAARLASKICHDLLGPAGALASGLEMLRKPPPGVTTSDALEAAETAAKSLTSQLAFARAAYGAGAGPGTAEAHALVADLFAGRRAEVSWEVSDSELPPAAAKALLHLGALGLAFLPYGGTARLRGAARGAQVLVGVQAVGERIQMHPDILAGLRGEPLGEALPGRWTPAAFLAAWVAGQGGSLTIDEANGAVAIGLPRG